MSKSEDSFTPEQRERITASIREAESRTSGEIRLFIEDKCREDALDRAAFIFKKLKMHETSHRNGVLIYLAFTSRKFAIIGDAGIHSKSHKDFWHDVRNEMQQYFVKGDFVTGLTNGIKMIGDALHKHFPHQKDDLNELPDDIVFGK